MIHLNKFIPHLLAVEVPEDAFDFQITKTDMGRKKLMYYSFRGTSHFPVYIDFPATHPEVQIIGLLSDCLKDERVAEKCLITTEFYYFKFEENGRHYSSARFALKKRLITESIDLSKNYILIKIL